jgi:hypothetical protein
VKYGRIYNDYQVLIGCIFMTWDKGIYNVIQWFCPRYVCVFLSHYLSCFFLNQAVTWTSDSQHFLQSTREQAKQCRTEEQVIDLLDLLEGFIRPGLNKQESRLKKIADLSAKLVIDVPRRKAKELVTKQKEVATKFDLMDNDLYRLAEKLRERNRLGLPPEVLFITFLVFRFSYKVMLHTISIGGLRRPGKGKKAALAVDLGSLLTQPGLLTLALLLAAVVLVKCFLISSTCHKSKTTMCYPLLKQTSFMLKYSFHYIRLYKMSPKVLTLTKQNFKAGLQTQLTKDRRYLSVQP